MVAASSGSTTATTSSSSGSGGGGGGGDVTCASLAFSGAGVVSVNGGVPGGLQGIDKSKMIGAWVWLDKANQTGGVVGFGDDAGSCGNPSCGGGRLDLTIENGSVSVGTAQAGFKQGDTLPLHTWLYVFAGFDKAQTGYFVGYVKDGKTVVSAPGIINTVGTNFLTTGQPVWFGNNKNNQAFVGKIDRVDVYSPAPTTAKIKELAAADDATVAAASETFWTWSFGEGSGGYTSESKGQVSASLGGALWSTEGYACSTSCGNGVLDGSEVCDDGNVDNTDVCTTMCETCDPKVLALAAGTSASGDAGSNPAWALGNEASIEYWVRFNQATEAGAGVMAVSTAYDDSSTGGWRCTVSPTAVDFTLRYTDPSSSLIAPLTLSKDAWHHVACDYDGATMRAFVNGKLAGMRSTSGMVDSYSQHLLLLHRNKFTAGAVKDFAVRQVRVGKKALHPGDFTPAWELVAAEGTVGLWTVNDGQGTMLANGLGGGPAFALAGSTSWKAYGAACLP